MGKIHLVTCQKGAEKAVQHIMHGEPLIGLAATGVSMGLKGELSLVVLTTGDGHAYVFDVKKHSDIMYQGLGRLLQSHHVLKVVHGSGPVTANLRAQFGISLCNIFDTQVAYSAAMEKQGLCGRRIPFSALCDKCCVQLYTPSALFQKLLAEDVHAWARRPLNRDMVNMAASSALPLVPTLYSQLLKVIKEDRWDWFCGLSEKTCLRLMKCKSTKGSPQQAKDQTSNKTSSPLKPGFPLSLTQRVMLKDTLPPAVQG